MLHDPFLPRTRCRSKVNARHQARSRTRVGGNATLTHRTEQRPSLSPAVSPTRFTFFGRAVFMGALTSLEFGHRRYNPRRGTRPRIELYTAPHDSVDQPGTWVQVGPTVTVPGIPGTGARLSPAFQLATPADPAPGADYKVIMLIAVVYPTGHASPPRDSITDLAALWRFLIAGIDRDMNAAGRALRWKAVPSRPRAGRGFDEDAAAERRRGLSDADQPARPTRTTPVGVRGASPTALAPTRRLTHSRSPAGLAIGADSR